MLEDTFIKLGEHELYWRDRYEWLKENGYELRPRFRPGWVPSWQGNPKTLQIFCEDSWRPPHPYVMDATDVHPYEVDISRYFTSLGPSPANHCVAILDVLTPPNEPNIAILVTPLLRAYDRPRFDSIGEAVEYFRQIFESSSVNYQALCSSASSSATVKSSSSSTRASSSVSASASQPAQTGFVKTSGTRFTLNGSLFTVVGSNSYWPALLGYNAADINQAFADITNSGATVTRTMGFNEVTSASGIYFHLWNGKTATVNTGANGLGAFDTLA
ncbi:Protein kinase domain-containing protein [Mycena indigotica]|uniref:Protein kinase domain-containing protein n=1 Tax=Mycena indigotica TaxID=2126181 RepID=A0A8H6TFQ0_9AGAR|nr:Protein kinase domain-containing protein [Mycena indigotica]KAF7315852.1 Protein kinase domain-containing protein [Mycena indigotica]